MKKVESVLDGFLGWGKTRTLTLFPHILFGLLFLVLPKDIYHTRGGGRRKRLPSSCRSAFQASFSLLFDITRILIRRLK
jgi:hypothetical protein